MRAIKRKFSEIAILMTREELLVLVSIGGHVGGAPKGPRGDFEKIVQAACEIVDIDYHGDFWSIADAELGTKVRGSLTLNAVK